MNIPIVLIHKGDHFYLNFSLNQIKITNPNAPVYLITDTVNNKHKHVTYIHLNSYFTEAEKFAKIYKHMSTNGFENELFCFQRWFILKEFCLDHKIEKVLYLDSDLLLYCDVEQVFNQFNNYDFTISKKLSPHCCYFPDSNKLLKFCDFIPKLYTDPSYTDRFLKKHQYHLTNHLNGGVCDMTAFNEYQKEVGVIAKDLNEIVDNEIFDDNISDVADGFTMKDGIKELIFNNGFYYGTKVNSKQQIKFNTLHFQGAAKKKIADYYLGSDLINFKLKLRFEHFLNNSIILFKIVRRLGYKFY
jgi:hypothetical protein